MIAKPKNKKFLQDDAGWPLCFLLLDENQIVDLEKFEIGTIMFKTLNGEKNFEGDIVLEEQGWVSYFIEEGDFDMTGFWLVMISLFGEDSVQKFTCTIEVIPKLGG